MTDLLSLPKQTKLPFRGVILPTILISPETQRQFGAKEGCSNLEFVTQLCRNGFRDKVLHRVPKEKHQRYVEQVKMELALINRLGFIDYIVQVWDICQYADSQGIPRGPGRGSVGSSLVAYLIGITEIDPIEYGLFFVRFLSEARAKSTVVDGVKYIDGSLIPDVDLDLSYHRRGEIIDYINRRYPGQTSKLLTTTTFTSKILIKDVLKVYKHATEQEAIDVSDLLEKEAGIPQEMEDAIWGNAAYRDKDEQHAKPPNEKFKEWAETGDNMETCEIAMALSGLNRNEGQHASAVLISAGPIRSLMPLQLAAAKEGDEEKVEVSGYDMYSAQEIVIKMDILGLRTLDVIDTACKTIGIKRRDIDVNHPSIYAFLQDFQRRYGIFQLETFAQGTAAAKVAPKNFEQLAAVLAIARPGAISQLDAYVKYVHEGVYNAIHPLIDDILRPTGSIVLYQEQYLAMLKRVGMTDERAENARRVLGKKKKEEVPAVIAEITEICTKNEHPKEIVDLLVKVAYDSGGYAFNKSHSAAYALITAYTIYLKTNYPLAFYHALLQMAAYEADSHAVIAQIEMEMRATGFNLLPPHLLKSAIDFRIEGEKGIRFGLGLIRGVSNKNVERIEAFLDKTRNSNFNKFEVFQALKNAGLNIGIVCSLIQAGCMEGFETYHDKDGKEYKSRSRLVMEAQTWGLLNDTEKKHALLVGAEPEVGWDVICALKYLAKRTNEKGKPLVKETRMDTLRKRYEPYGKIYALNSRNEHLANYFYEKKVLGYSYSETLARIFGQEVDGLITCAEAGKAAVDSRVRVIGFVEDFLKGKTKRKNDEIKFRLLDETGELRVKAFNEKIAQIEKENGRLPESGDLCIVSGKKMSGDTLFCEAFSRYSTSILSIQTTKIYMKLADLKDTTKAKTEQSESVESGNVASETVAKAVVAS